VRRRSRRPVPRHRCPYAGFPSCDSHCRSSRRCDGFAIHLEHPVEHDPGRVQSAFAFGSRASYVRSGRKIMGLPPSHTSAPNQCDGAAGAAAKRTCLEGRGGDSHVEPARRKLTVADRGSRTWRPGSACVRRQNKSPRVHRWRPGVGHAARRSCSGSRTRDCALDGWRGGTSFHSGRASSPAGSARLASRKVVPSSVARHHLPLYGSGPGEPDRRLLTRRVYTPLARSPARCCGFPDTITDAAPVTSPDLPYWLHGDPIAEDLRARAYQ